MREIKFRAWHKDRMIPWVENLDDGTGGVRMYFSQMIVDKDVILMQYTGLKDRSGKEIYDGDILKDGKGQYGQVLWAHNSWLVKWDERDYREYPMYQTMNDDCFCCGEVCGNIYENPELLEAKK